MAKYRMVNVKFWDDTYIGNLDTTSKLLFLYFFTNPLTTISGIYEIQLKRIALDTGLDKETVEKVLVRFEKDGKMTFRDGWIYIKNFIKNQMVNASVLQGVEREIQLIPNDVIKLLQVDWIQLVDSVGTACGQGGGKLKLILKPKLNLNLNLTTTICSEQKIDFDFKKWKFQNITDGFIFLMQEKFPAVNIKSELAKMEAWFISNPKNKKSNYERFITNWLIKAQDKSMPKGGNNGTDRKYSKTTDSSGSSKYDGIGAVAET